MKKSPKETKKYGFPIYEHLMSSYDVKLVGTQEGIERLLQDLAALRSEQAKEE